MTSEEYQKVKVVFQSVLEVEPNQRTAFLDDACRNNEDLRREVERLLGNYESGFMEETAIQNVLDISESQPLETGDKIGRFKIIGKIGKGGMGEVYLAHDKSLGRDVAIKVLLSEFSSDKDRVNRFKLEAKAASALNHPNIITIYEIGEDDGKLFIATEQIKGETLRNLIQDKKLDITSSIRIAEQIASALNAAHKAGIIHRDIKPENIIVREDGFVKVLDFGLAKPMTLDSEAATNELVATKKGMIMGSVGYMSPEQARGLKVDARTDLWSLGVVLYEMLTGNPPFQADTMTDILANIIHKEPVSLSEQVDAPHELYDIVEKTLQKERDERFQNANDLSLDFKNLRREMELEHELELSVSQNRLQEIPSRINDVKRTDNVERKATNELQETQLLSEPIDTQTSREIAKPKSKYKTAIFVTFLCLLIGSSIYLGYSYLKPKKLIETAFKNTTVEKIPLKGKVSTFAISPDGKYLAYIIGEMGMNGRLILKQLETGSEKEMFAAEAGSFMYLKRFSPDGNYLFFEGLADDGVTIFRRIALLGGETKDIPFGSGAEISFSSDGKRMLFNRSPEDEKETQIIISDLDGSNETIVYSTKDLHVLSPKFSPDESKIILFYNDQAEQDGINAKLGWIPTTGGEITRIGTNTWDTSLSLNVPIPQYEWLPDGSGIIIINRIMHKENAQIYLVSFPDGEITPITNDTNSYEFLSATVDRKTMVTFKQTGLNAIWEYDLQTKIAKQITPTSNLVNVSNLIEISFGIAATDDNKIIYTKSDGKGNLNLWQVNTDGSGEKLLLAEKGRIETPIVSPDGKQIYFTTNTMIGPLHFPTNAVWRMDINGGNLKQLTAPEGAIHKLLSVLPDNNSILFQEWTSYVPDAKVNKLNIATGEITMIYEDEKVFMPQFELSPDGKKILFLTATKLFDENFVVTNGLADFDGIKIGSIQKLPFPAGKDPSYSFADNKFFYYFDYRNRQDIWRYDFSNNKSTKITNFNFDTIYNFTVSRDGKKLYIVRGNTTDEVILIKNVD